MGAGYKTMSDLMIGFHKIGCLPKARGLSCLGDGNELKQHDSCRQNPNTACAENKEKT